MKRYVAIDSGKHATKVAEYIPSMGAVNKFSIKTKVSDGDFRDDAIEDATVVVEIGGKTYKVGNGARGNGAALDTSKQSEIHKICTITALAYLASQNEEDEFYVAVGLPAKDWAVVSKRMDYKDYILPEENMTVSIKPKSSSPVKEKKFKITKRFVYPESIGALFMDETIGNTSSTSITGVIDIGNLNLNATLWQGNEFLDDFSVTAELGGAILIQELSQEIQANITACDEMIATNILVSNERVLPDGFGLTDEQIEQSKDIITRVLRTHAEKVRKVCRARGWSLDLIRVVAIGGTSKVLENELKECFGESLIVLPNTEYCNVLGYLRIMCAQLEEIATVIPIDVTKESVIVKEMKDKASKAKNQEQ